MRVAAKMAMAFALVFAFAGLAQAGGEKSLKRDGWITYETDIPFEGLYPRLKEALKEDRIA